MTASGAHQLPFPAPQAAGVPTDRSSSVGWKPYNRSQICSQLPARASETALWPRGGMGPKNRIRGSRPEIGPCIGAFARCKSRNALGLRAVEPKTRVRSFCSGEQYDQDLGLYYLRARYYNPNTGRFLSRDPLDGLAKDPASLHKYLYANGDPINGIDPSGRADAYEYAALAAITYVVLQPVKFFLGCGKAGKGVSIVGFLITPAITGIFADISWTLGWVSAAMCWFSS